MSKMLVSDYDQTFYLNDEDMELNKRGVLEFQKKNNLFVIATGRSYFDFHNKLDVYHFSYDYVILNHGATIVNRANDVLFNTSLNNSIISELKKTLKLEESISYFCCSGLESRVSFEHQDLTKINVKYKSYEFAMDMVEVVNHKFSQYVNAYYVNNESIEIISIDTHKARAIYEVMKENHITKENVYTIGDGYNDIEMIKEFNGYSMKDAVKELKDSAIGEVSSVSDLIKIIME